MKEMQGKLLKHLKSKSVQMEDATRRSRTLIASNNELESNNRDLARANDALRKKLASVQKAKVYEVYLTFNIAHLFIGIMICINCTG